MGVASLLDRLCMYIRHRITIHSKLTYDHNTSLNNGKGRCLCLDPFLPNVCGGKTMLEQLASINWSALSHAYGSAADVPHLLLDLTSSDEQTRESALGTLYTNIYHQGTVYQASAYAVPFLLELLRDETMPEREGLLVLLAHLARGNTYHRQHWHFYSEERKQDPALLAELEEGVFWVEQTYEAVSAGLPLYCSLLDDPSPKLRMAALRLLGSLSR